MLDCQCHFWNLKTRHYYSEAELLRFYHHASEHRRNEGVEKKRWLGSRVRSVRLTIEGHFRFGRMERVSPIADWFADSIGNIFNEESLEHA